MNKELRMGTYCVHEMGKEAYCIHKRKRRPGWVSLESVFLNLSTMAFAFDGDHELSLLELKEPPHLQSQAFSLLEHTFRCLYFGIKW